MVRRFTRIHIVFSQKTLKKKRKFSLLFCINYVGFRISQCNVVFSMIFNETFFGNNASKSTGQGTTVNQNAEVYLCLNSVKTDSCFVDLS